MFVAGRGRTGLGRTPSPPASFAPSQHPYPRERRPMKLVRFGNPGAEKPGVVDGHGVIRDVSGYVSDFTGATLSPASLGMLRGLDTDALPLAPAGARIGAPVAGTRNFIAIGLNFADHAKETNHEIPS